LHPSMMSSLNRVVVIGVSGSGKSTVAAELAAQFGLQHTELDAIAQSSGWTVVPREEFDARLSRLLEVPTWVVDGNYIDWTSTALWPRANTIVWLDLPLRTVLPRLLKRSVGRIVRRKVLWNGNREHWSSLVGRDSVLVWAVQSHRRHRTELPELLEGLAMNGTAIVRLRSSAEVRTWRGRQSLPAQS
jgi:adenylate kinase family enzyme